jgi:hypothetical protein
MRHARHYKQFVRDHGYKAWVQKLIFTRGYQLPIQWHEAQNEIEAYVHRDAWVADCPSCSGAMIVDDTEPLFFCVDCHNADNDGKPYRVNFPNQDEVEALMAMRANPQARNWYPGETVEDLIEEQIEHGELY